MKISFLHYEIRLPGYTILKPKDDQEWWRAPGQWNNQMDTKKKFDSLCQRPSFGNYWSQPSTKQMEAWCQPSYNFENKICSAKLELWNREESEKVIDIMWPLLEFSGKKSKASRYEGRYLYKQYPWYSAGDALKERIVNKVDNVIAEYERGATYFERNEILDFRNISVSEIELSGDYNWKRRFNEAAPVYVNPKGVSKSMYDWGEDPRGWFDPSELDNQEDY